MHSKKHPQSKKFISALQFHFPLPPPVCGPRLVLLQLGTNKRSFQTQKSAIRIISGAAYNAHTEPLFKKLEILPLPDLISFAKLQFMQRFIQKLLPNSFKDIWVYNCIGNIGENEIQLRNHLQIQQQHLSLARLNLFPLYSFPKNWESFPDQQIKILRKNSEFDKKLKHYFITDLPDTVDCGRLLCAACLAGRA